MRKKITYIVLVFLTLAGCGKSGSNDGDATAPITSSPEKAILLFPSQNSVCVTGTTLSATQSSVVLNWSAGGNAESYEITIKNLLTNTPLTQTVTTSQATITLLSSTPYSWFVVSKSSKTTITAQSDTWKFYNSGPGGTYYAPFPADLLAPALGSTVIAINGITDLSWTGSDADKDITGYDVYLSTNANPVLFKGSVTDMFLKGAPVTPGSLYYWKVISRDAHGNTSSSAIFSFTVQ